MHGSTVTYRSVSRRMASPNFEMIWLRATNSACRVPCCLSNDALDKREEKDTHVECSVGTVHASGYHFAIVNKDTTDGCLV